MCYGERLIKETKTRTNLELSLKFLHSWLLIQFRTKLYSNSETPRRNQQTRYYLKESTHYCRNRTSVKQLN